MARIQILEFRQLYRFRYDFRISVFEYSIFEGGNLGSSKCPNLILGLTQV